MEIYVNRKHPCLCQALNQVLILEGLFRWCLVFTVYPCLLLREDTGSGWEDTTCLDGTKLDKCESEIRSEPPSFTQPSSQSHSTKFAFVVFVVVVCLQKWNHSRASRSHKHQWEKLRSYFHYYYYWQTITSSDLAVGLFATTMKKICNQLKFQQQGRYYINKCQLYTCPSLESC